jgi:hypothetical protein
MTIRFVALLSCACGLLAQEQKVGSAEAPPEVDAALRARIRQFYQAHVDAKYRVADQVVAEDSKDAYFAAAKPKYLGFAIVKVTYSDSFTKAESIVSCEAEWYFHGNKSKVKVPATSLWKLIDGQWYWYVVPVTERQTPFGTMHYNAANQGPSPSAPIPGDPQVLAQQILASVRADKKVLTLSSYRPSSGEVTITNGMQGSISLRADIDGRFPGLTFSLSKTELKAGETAILKVVCDPEDRVAKPTLTAKIYVEPISQVLPVQLMFSIPPEVEKLIPKEARQPQPTP